MEEKKSTQKTSNAMKIVGIGIALLLIALISTISFSGGSEGKAQIAFALENYEGNTVSLSDINSPVVFINTWASWCPFCVDELPDFVDLQKEFGELVTIVAINRGESRNTAKEFIDANGWSDKLVFLMDPTESFYRSTGGFGMPETIVLNENREIILHKRSRITIEEARDIINLQ